MTQPDSYDLLATAVVLVNSQGEVAFANSSAEELFGLSRRQMLGIPALALFQPDITLDPHFPDAIAGQFGVLRQDASIRASGGLGVAVNLVVVPLQHQSWAALLEIRGLDQHDVIDRTLQLTKELNVQRESLRNLAHEVKNPLGGIRGAAQLLDAELDDSTLCEYTRVIVAEADRLTSLIDRLIAPQGDTLVRHRFNIHS